MQPYDHPRPDHLEMFAAFGVASYHAQVFESLVLTNLQYSLALAGDFKSLDEVDRSAAKLGTIPLGQLFERLKNHLADSQLRAEVEQGISTRNALAHHFFRTRTAGIVMTPTETADAITWCRAAHVEFSKVSGQLQARADDLFAIMTRDPDAIVPGMAARMTAAFAGEWP